MRLEADVAGAEDVRVEVVVEVVAVQGLEKLPVEAADVKWMNSRIEVVNSRRVVGLEISGRSD